MVAHPAQESSVTSSKECFKCKTVRPLEEFYKHLQMGDGHLNKCKQCTKNDVNKYRAENIEKVREYDRNRGKTIERIKLAAEITREWRSQDLRRLRAHNKVARAIKNGLLVREPCVRCGETKSLAHHEDYDKPLDVMWLCQPCHKNRHKELREKNA